MTVVEQRPVVTTTTGSGVRMGRRTTIAVVLASAVGIVAFFWPFLAAADSAVVAHASDAPWFKQRTQPRDDARPDQDDGFEEREGLLRVARGFQYTPYRLRFPPARLWEDEW